MYFSNAGAKVPLLKPYPNFIQPFFNVFLTFQGNCLKSWFLNNKVFLGDYTWFLARNEKYPINTVLARVVLKN